MVRQGARLVAPTVFRLTAAPEDESIAPLKSAVPSQLALQVVHLVDPLPCVVDVRAILTANAVGNDRFASPQRERDGNAASRRAAPPDTAMRIAVGQPRREKGAVSVALAHLGVPFMADASDSWSDAAGASIGLELAIAEQFSEPMRMLFPIARIGVDKLEVHAVAKFQYGRVVVDMKNYIVHADLVRVSAAFETGRRAHNGARGPTQRSEHPIHGPQRWQDGQQFCGVFRCLIEVHPPPHSAQIRGRVNQQRIHCLRLRAPRRPSLNYRDGRQAA